MTEKDFERIGQLVAQVVDSRLERIDARFDRIDARLDQMDARLDQMDARFEQIDARFEQMDARFDRIEGRLDDHDVKFDRISEQIHELRVEQEDFSSSLNLIIEGQQLQTERLARLESRVDTLESNLSRRIDFVAAELTSHRADTEAHHGVYRVKESSTPFDGEHPVKVIPPDPE